jgi:hypothetical protein
MVGLVLHDGAAAMIGGRLIDLLAVLVLGTFGALTLYYVIGLLLVVVGAL